MAREPKLEIASLMGTAAAFKLLDFREANGLATKDQKREQMLARCQQIYERADQRERQSGRGAAFADPDCHAMVKCVELSAKLMGLFSDDQSEGDQRETDIRKIAKLLESAGYEVKKVA
jgi:hypothetical protein